MLVFVEVVEVSPGFSDLALIGSKFRETSILLFGIDGLLEIVCHVSSKLSDLSLNLGQFLKDHLIFVRQEKLNEGKENSSDSKFGLGLL